MENVKCEMLIRLNNIHKSYKNGDKVTHILNGLSMNIQKGEAVAIMGKSGCGKTTLLNILGGLDGFDEGEYYYKNEKIIFDNYNKLAKFRRERIGFIVQNFALINHINVYDNIALPLRCKKIYKKALDQKVNELLDMVGLRTELNKYPNQLSGGECQRVAIARALANDPELILADEPTGSLDIAAQEVILGELLKLNTKFNKTIVLVTHDIDVAENCSRIINI